MIYLIAGQKRTGKTLSTISLLGKRKKNYDYFFSNFPVVNFIKIDSKEWVKYKFPRNSCILIDEAQLYFNSRAFAMLTRNGLGDALLDYLTMCGHYGIDIYFITQSANRIDLQIRELSDYIYFIKKTYKIPFIKKPFLVRGLEFHYILEFEKYINPNNFGTECKANWLFKIIHKKDLKAFDTHYVWEDYINKPEIPLSYSWLNITDEITEFDTSQNEQKGIFKQIKQFMHYITNNIKKLFFKVFLLKRKQTKIIDNIEYAEMFGEIKK